uniref:ABC transporter n=1 Tax=Thermosporothrix sp. COM3 TaxID=2490863 RepID=A0A455SFN0_9CHLR|nr:ABC transporter [Thermosporothrix sp. COM3]
MALEFSTARKHVFNQTNVWRWLLSHIARFKLFFLLYLTGSLLWQALASAIPRVSGLAIDSILQRTPSLSTFTWLVLALLVIVLLRGGISIGSNYSLERFSNSIEREVRDELYLSLLGKGQAFFNRHQVGDLMARATDDTTQINEMFAPGLDILLNTLLNFVWPMIFIAFINPVLLLTPIVFMILFILAIVYYNQQLAPVSSQMRTQNGLLTAEATEAVAGFEIIEITGQKDQASRRFAELVRSFRDLFVRQGRVQAAYLPPLLLSFAIAGAFIHGLYLVTHGALAVGDLIAYLGLVGLLRAPTADIGFSLLLLQGGLASGRRILDVLRDQTGLDENLQGHKERLQGELVFEHVSFEYEGTPIVKDISFTVKPGQTLALVGPTGSGKTTITRLINRIYDVSSGRILLDGVDVQNWNLDTLRSQIGIIEQDVLLFSRSIADNIAFGTGGTVSQQQIEEAAQAAQAHGFISAFKDGYQTLVGERGVTLSGGQRQRLAIARALLTDPRILILDDSTSAVDSVTEEEIQRAIRRVLSQRTTILITHRLSQIRRADSILLLDQGQVVDQGTHEELLMRCPLYQHIFAPYYRLHRAQAGEQVLTTPAPDVQ